MKKRIKTIQKELRGRGAYVLLVSDPKNIFYLSGFMPSSDEREALLLITKSSVTLFVSPLSVSTAQKISSVRCISATQGLFSRVTKKIRADRTVFFEDHDLSVRELAFLRKNTKAEKIQWKKNREIVREARKVKNAQEIRKIKRACEITDAVFDKMIAFLKRSDYTKITERELAEKMLVWGKDLGAERWAFDPIVALGSHSAVPHHVNTDKKLKKNAPLLLDFGFAKDGYNSDMTRTIFLGNPSKKFIQMYDLVLQANQECAMMAMEGVTGAELHAHAVRVFDLEARLLTLRSRASKCSEYFIHALGHGLGIDVHELPHISLQGNERLKSGEVITIEPGLYFEGHPGWGIRIEDDIVVGGNKSKILTKSSKGLIII